MFPPYYFCWFRIDDKYMTEPWLDQALMDSAYTTFNGTAKINTLLQYSGPKNKMEHNFI